MSPRRQPGTIARVIAQPLHINPDGRVYQGEQFMGYIGNLEKIDTTVVGTRDPIYTTLRFDIQVVPTNPEEEE